MDLVPALCLVGENESSLVSETAVMHNVGQIMIHVLEGMEMDDRLTPSAIYEMVAEVGFKKYFHLGGSEATKELIDLCPINENSRVIDIGCASGKTACYLARRYGCSVMGVDILPRMGGSNY
jgi:SAM-dependent methyltransferase